MAELRYPLGLPRPGTVGGADSIIARQQASVRRWHNPIEPPEEMDVDPLLVPLHLWRQVQREQILRHSAGIATLQDAGDLSFNAQVEAAREDAAGERPGLNPRALQPERRPGTSPSDIATRDLLRAVADARLSESLTKLRAGADPDMLILGGEQFGPDRSLTLDNEVERRLTDEITSAQSLSSRALRPDEINLRRRQIRNEVWVERQPAYPAGDLAVATIEQAGMVLGVLFDGKRFIRHQVVALTSAVETRFGTSGSMAEARQRNEREFDELYEELPRPFQILIEEMSPGNIAVVLGGGLLARTLVANGSRAATLLARFVEPISSGPTAFPREVAAATLGRVAFEETEGAPGAVRGVAFVAGVLAGASPESLVRPAFRGVRAVATGINSLDDSRALLRAGGVPEQSTAGILSIPGSGFRPRIAGASLDPPTATTPGVVHPPPLAQNVFGMRDIEYGLTRREELWNVFRRTVGRAVRMIEDDPIATPAMRERERLGGPGGVIDSVAAQFGQSHGELMRRSFTFDDAGLIPNLAGVIDELPNGPALSDLAARLPLFEDVLTPSQRSAIRELRDTLSPFRELYDAVGGEVGTRIDIMDGGFYVPRGRTALEGADAPLRVGGRGREGRAGFEAAAAFESQAEGIAAGFQYAPVGDVLQAYVRESGRRSLNLHIANYFDNVIDPMTGNRVAGSMADRIPSGLRARVESLRSRVTTRRQTLARRRVRAVDVTTEAGRAARRAETATERTARRAERAPDADAYSAGELMQARDDLGAAVTTGRHLVREISENATRLRQARGRLSTADSQIEARIEELSREIAAADELSGREFGQTRRFDGADPADLPLMNRHEVRVSQAEYEAHLSAADRITRQIEALADGSDGMARRVDELIERGEVLGDMDQAAREQFSNARRLERSVMAHDRTVEMARRELNALEREHGRLARIAAESGQRADAAVMRRTATEGELARFQDELRDISAQWRWAQRRARQTPIGEAPINLPGLQSKTFPELLAAAANKVVVKEGPPSGPGAPLVSFINAFNNLYRGTTATLDISGPGIQGLLGLADDTVAYGQALKMAIRAWGEGGDELLGAYIRVFNDQASQSGLLSSGDWTKLELHIGGGLTEFSIPNTIAGVEIGKLPLIRQANRSFGFFGDTLRLGWANDLLEAEIRKGRNLQEIVSSGDATRIAKAANSMTGYSNTRFASDIGEFLLFAPRFLQSRLETVVRGVAGLRPGASLEQRLARRALGKLIGYGTLMTVGVNWVLGNDTDFRVLKNGRPNPDFMRIRLAGRDWSVFGTWDSLLRAIILTGQGKPQDAFRGLASGAVSIGWDLIAGTNFRGDETRPQSIPVALADPVETAKLLTDTIVGSFLPFATEELPEAAGLIASGVRGRDPQRVGAGALTVVGEAFGVRSTPLSGFERTQEARTVAVQGQVFVDPGTGRDFSVDTIEELEKRIGTLSARRLADGLDATGVIGELAEARIIELQGAAARNDRTAQALLIGFNPDPEKPGTVQRLAALARDVTTGVVQDRAEYRRRRGEIMSEQRGKLLSYADVFAGFASSGGEVDTDSSQWFALFDQARTGTGEIDWNRFEALEAGFAAALGEERFLRMTANVTAVDPRANALEQEYLTVRAEVEAAGFYEIGQIVWTVAQPEVEKRTGISFKSYEDYFDWQLQQLVAMRITFGAGEAERTRILKGEATPREDPSLALQRAKIDIRRVTDVALYTETLRQLRVKWAADNGDLGATAIKWGYLSASEANLEAAEAAEPEARSQLSDVEQQAQAFLSGSSYGQIAIKFGVEGVNPKATVEQRLRRHFGGSPLAARVASQEA